MFCFARCDSPRRLRTRVCIPCRRKGDFRKPCRCASRALAIFSPDGTRVVFSPLTRDFRTWKRYEGGWAQDLFIFDLSSYDFKQITDSKRTDRDPMWVDDAIYFTSDRTGTFNIFRYDTVTGTTRQITQSTTADVRWPSMGGTQIIYELAGELHVLHTESNESTRLSIHVPTDSLATRVHRESVGGSIRDYAISPNGQRGRLQRTGRFALGAGQGRCHSGANADVRRTRKSPCLVPGRKAACFHF